MRHFRTRIAVLAMGLSWLLSPPPGWAADHSDGWLDIAVLAGLDLIEGPPYPTPSVEMDVALRIPGAASLPSGRLLLGLTTVEDSASGEFVAVTASAVDNAQLGEAGDAAVMDVYFVPSSPPYDEFPGLSRFEWLLASSPGTAGRQFEFSPIAPIVKLSPVQVETRIAGDIFEGETVELPDYGRLDLDFGIHPGQALEFASAEASALGPGSQLRVVFDLRVLASGSVDTGEPLFRVSITSEPLQALPALPPVGIGGLAVMLLALGLLGLARFSKRDGGYRT